MESSVFQWIANIIMTIFGLLVTAGLAMIGYIMRGHKDELEALRKKDDEHTTKLHHIENIVAGDYAKTKTVDRQFDQLSEKIDAMSMANGAAMRRLEDRLDKRLANQ